MRHSSFLYCVLFTTAFALLSASSNCGAEDPPAKGADKKAADKKPAGKADSTKKKGALSDEDEWKRLMARKQELIKESESIFAQGQNADDAGRKKLGQRIQQLQAEFQTDLGPAIMNLAPKIYEKDPTEPNAAEVMTVKALEAGDFESVVKMADKVIDAEKGTAPLVTYKGIALFNSGEFDSAVTTFEEARKLDKKSFAQAGAPFLDLATKYSQYWKDELALREKEKEADDLPRVLLKTNRGDIELELFENEAPNTVANFVSLVEAGKYDGTLFHRVIPGFMSQGGDPNSLDDNPGNDGGGGPGYTIACECYTDKARKHFQGSLSMAHAGRDSGGSQFFLTHRPTPHLDYQEGKTESNHTVFGRILKGLDVAVALKKGDKIEEATVIRKRDHKYVPETLTEKRTRGAKGGKPKTEKTEE